jgi:hypothetical protein
MRRSARGTLSKARAGAALMRPRRGSGAVVEMPLKLLARARYY